MDEDVRFEALSQAVRVTLAKGGAEDDSATVARAKAYEDFLTGN
jgi:hypothetical protein